MQSDLRVRRRNARAIIQIASMHRYNRVRQPAASNSGKSKSLIVSARSGLGSEEVRRARGERNSRIIRDRDFASFPRRRADQFCRLERWTTRLPLLRVNAAAFVFPPRVIASRFLQPADPCANFEYV